MNIAKIFLIALVAVFGNAALANDSAYRSLKKVSLQKPQQPRLQNGFQRLAQNEARYAENLPMQLNGAIKSVESRKYKPSRRYQ